MNRENEKRVVEEICYISEGCNYSNDSELENALRQVKDRDYFRESIFGKRYIQRLTMLCTGVSADDCVLCGREAINHIVCNTCMQKLSQLGTRRRKMESQAWTTPKVVPDVGSYKEPEFVVMPKQENEDSKITEPVQIAEPSQNNNTNTTLNNNNNNDINNDINGDITIEELFKDMDDSLLQLASQVTAKSIKRLSWINIGLSIINFILIFFLTLFLWKFITSQ